MLGFFCKNLDATEFCFPTLAFVLSTLKLAQLFYGISSASNDFSIASKIFEALPVSSPSVKHILKKCSDTVLEFLISNILTETGFIFCTPVSYDPSWPTLNGLRLQLSTRKL